MMTIDRFTLFALPDKRCKLGWPEVRAIRKSYAEGATLITLALTYDITCPAVHNIVRARHWRHDPELGPVPPAPRRKRRPTVEA